MHACEPLTLEIMLLICFIIVLPPTSKFWLSSSTPKTKDLLERKQNGKASRFIKVNLTKPKLFMMTIFSRPIGHYRLPWGLLSIEFSITTPIKRGKKISSLFYDQQSMKRFAFEDVELDRIRV